MLRVPTIFDVLFSMLFEVRFPFRFPHALRESGKRNWELVDWSRDGRIRVRRRAGSPRDCA